MPGPGGHGGPMGGHSGGPRGPMGGPGGPRRPMGGPPPHHHYGLGWGYRRPYHSGCLGGCLTLILGCGSIFTLILIAIFSIL